MTPVLRACHPLVSLNKGDPVVITGQPPPEIAGLMIKAYQQNCFPLIRPAIKPRSFKRVR